MADDTTRLSLDEALALCLKAAKAAGAREETARAIAVAAVDAEAEGQPNVGLSHFIDYLDSLKAGRIDRQALPAISKPAPAIFLSDARGGAAHTGFDQAFDDIVGTARTFGLALFSQRNAYTAGSLGYYGTRLAAQGLVSIAATNGPALITGAGATKPIYCTNPLAFVAPVAGGPPLIIDQSSSATAFVSVRQAAAEGRTLPEGWALDREGRPTTDPTEAMKGALLTFGGARGANIALMVDVLAAGISGAKWSIDAGSITDGNASPGSGLFVLALAPELIDPEFSTRMAAQVDRLGKGYGVHIPGLRKKEARERAARDGISVPKAVYERIAAR
jgi:(2R)-3-sulfolactate dehydrogenase (NADP+)